MASPPGKNLVISAALTEYTALRAEVTNRISGQDTMLNLYMTAVAAIFGFALSGHADLLILLVLPPLSTAARLLYHNHNLYIKLVSAYLNDQLRLDSSPVIRLPTARSFPFTSPESVALPTVTYALFCVSRARPGMM